MNDLIIRRAQESDVEGIADLEQLCFASPWSKESLMKEMKENGLALYLVGEIENKIVGYVGVWNILDEGHITNVAVHPEFRRRGIGEALIKVLIAHCAQKGILRQTLEVRPSNEAALNLYEKFGFQIVGRRKAYYDDNGEDALIMWRGIVGDTLKK